jgi:ketosteroid isomerase-like protein
MKKLVVSILSACVCGGLVLAYPTETPSKSASVADTLKQVEQDFGDAIVAADVDKIDQILEDDWVELSGSGRTFTKANILGDLKSGKDKLESFEIGPMDVKVLGNVAVVHGTATEKRTFDGRDTSGKRIWMDVFVKHGDRWVIVRSCGAIVR